MAEGNPLGSLAVGTEAQLRYAEDFTSAALDVRLLEVDEDLLQEILHTGVTIKGGDTQPAVLCTERKTFALVELPFTSNSLVLVPPTGVEAAGPAVIVTGACPATGHLELSEVAPPLSALRAVLRARPYSEACEGDGAARRSVGYTWGELCEAVHCSSAQLLDGLAQHGALCLDDRWVVLDAGYTRRVLDLAVMNAGIHGWPLDGMPLEGAVDALVGDGIDPPVARHVITMFASPPTADGAADGSVALDARAVCAEKACSLLEERTVWRLPDFEAAWTKACPQDMPPQLDILRGLALVEPQGADHTVSAFLASDLPPKPKERFAMLFARKERWSRPELEPYLAHVEEAKASVEGLLLAWCRRSTSSAGEEVFTQRHAG